MTVAQIPLNAVANFLDEFKAITRRMDRAYDQAAEANGFVCNGCLDNCCETRFYHHTYIEYYLLAEGMLSLASPMRAEIVARAAEVCKEADAVEARSAPYRIMCPLNFEGMCRLYAFRPMICRMHGISHVLSRPDGVRIKGPGCRLFEKSCGAEPKVYFDRTPFYRQTAELEKKLRTAFSLHNKLKLTIARMVLKTTDGE